MKEIIWHSTDPEQQVQLGYYTRYTDTFPVPWITTYKQFFEYLSHPSPDLNSKDGPCFLIGPCDGRRRADNIPYGVVASFDADSSLDSVGVKIEGAPPALQITSALKKWNISHCLYTTYSHGAKGNRYRLIFPVVTRSPAELRAFITYIGNILQGAGLPIAITKESYTWGQGWALPRVRSETSIFFTSSHFGITPCPASLAEYYNFSDQGVRKAPEPQRNQKITEHSPIATFLRYIGLQDQLEDHGYEFFAQSIIPGQDGEPVPCMRYRKPGSTSTAGVVVFQDEQKIWRAYSHHKNDPLCNGHSNDAFDAYQILNGFETEEDALIAAVPVLQQCIDEELNDDYPSIMQGGNKFRICGKHTTDRGQVSYRPMELSSFNALCTNKPGVPVQTYDEEGHKSLAIIPLEKYWMKAQKRRLFNDLVYEPCPMGATPKKEIKRADGKPYLNSFLNWGLTPQAGPWDLIDWHIRHVFCNNNDQYYEYFMNWWAHLFQFPQDKPGVALVVRGGRGWGKSMFFNQIAEALGSHAYLGTRTDDLTSRFNSHLYQKLLFVADEVIWGGERKHVGALQGLITEKFMGFEAKGQDSMTGRSFLRLVIISNEDWVVPAAADERRFFVLPVRDVGKTRDTVDGVSGRYFPKLNDQLLNGGIEALVHHLTHEVKVDHNLLLKAPPTAELNTQKLLSLGWKEAWLYGILNDGRVKLETGYVNWGRGLCLEAMEARESFLGAITPRERKYKTPLGLATEMGIYLKQVFKGTTLYARTKDAGNNRYYNFGPLQQCRKVFENYLNMEIAWPSVSGAENTGFNGVPDGSKTQH